MGNVPGWEFECKKIKLFTLDGTEYMIGVKSMGLGRVGYFFEYRCGGDGTQETNATAMAAKLQNLFKVASAVKDVKNFGAAIGAVLLAVLAPGAIEDAAAGTAFTTQANNIIQFVGNANVAGAVDAAKTLQQLFDLAA